MQPISVSFSVLFAFGLRELFVHKYSAFLMADSPSFSFFHQSIFLVSSPHFSFALPKCLVEPPYQHVGFLLTGFEKKEGSGSL